MTAKSKPYVRSSADWDKRMTRQAARRGRSRNSGSALMQGVYQARENRLGYAAGKWNKAQKYQKERAGTAWSENERKVARAGARSGAYVNGNAARQGRGVHLMSGGSLFARAFNKIGRQVHAAEKAKQ